MSSSAPAFQAQCISAATYQPAGSGIVRLPFLALVRACACLHLVSAMKQEHDRAVR